jgi:hypothetical protein
MKQLIEDLISALEYHVEQTRPIYSTTVALQAAREALKSLPPQRTWVGLDEKDFSAINQSCLTKLQAATSAESILKEKNT